MHRSCPVVYHLKLRINSFISVFGSAISLNNANSLLALKRIVTSDFDLIESEDDLPSEPDLLQIIVHKQG